MGSMLHSCLGFMLFLVVHSVQKNSHMTIL